jgi:hypothetical protein
MTLRAGEGARVLVSKLVFKDANLRWLNLF